MPRIVFSDYRLWKVWHGSSVGEVRDTELPGFTREDAVPIT